MEVVRFTWKPSQTTWIQLKLKPLSPTSLRASPWSFGQKTSEIRIQTLAQAPPLQCTLRNWHEVFVHTNQLTSFKAKIGSKSFNQDFIPSFKKHGAFPAPAHLSCSTYSWWPWRQLSDIQPLFSRRSWSSPCREIISIQSKGFERVKNLGMVQRHQQAISHKFNVLGHEHLKMGDKHFETNMKNKNTNDPSFLENYLACHQGCHSKYHASVPFRTTRAYGDVWDPSDLPSRCQGTEFIPSKLHGKASPQSGKMFEWNLKDVFWGWLITWHQWTCRNYQNSSKAYLWCSRDPRHECLYFRLSFFTHLSSFLLWSLAEEQMNFRSASTATSDDRMDNIIGKPMLQHAIDETGKLCM